MMTKTRQETQWTAEIDMPDRRYDIDWLRVFTVVVLLVPYHTFRVFDLYNPFYVKNNQLSTALNWYLSMGDTIGMQLLFLLAGAATWFALRGRSGGRYAWDRFRRLLVPLVFGLLVVVPPQSYLGLRYHSNYAESFLQWYPSFFKFNPEDVEGYFLGGFTFAHLWFILFLFVITVLALPLFLYLKRDSGRKVTAKLVEFVSRPGAIFLLVIPLFLAERLLDFYPNPLYFLIYYIFGYVLLTDERLEEAIGQAKGLALISGALAFLVFLAWSDLGAALHFNLPQWLATTFRRCIVSWLLIVAILGYGKKYLNSPPTRRSSTKFLGYFGEGSYPFYILHQTIIVAIAFYVTNWATSITIKYVLIALATYAAVMLIYDLLVRRNNVSRFLFGMRPLKRIAEGI